MSKTQGGLTVVEEFAQSIRIERKKAKISQISASVVLVLLVVFFSVFAEGFFLKKNFIVILNQLAIPLILAIGATFVILSGSIDLSIEGLMSLAGTLAAYFVLNTSNGNDMGYFSIVIVVAIGFLVGLLTGFMQVKTKIPSFLLTFAISSIISGVTLLIYKGIPIGIKDESYLAIAYTSFLRIPVLTWIAFFVFVFAFILERYTAFGRYVYAIGSNENIPKSNGININRIKMLVFAFAGTCVGLGGVLGASRITHGDLSVGAGNLFPTLTAVVLGGTALSGGRGGVVNTLIGTVIVTVLNNGLILLGVSPFVITGIQGLIILAAVALSIERGKGQTNK